jgi:hypothetical protein
MAKRVYFAFHYQDVIDFRANVVRKHNFAEGADEAGYYDHSIWEEAQKSSPSALKKLINAELENTSVTVVLIGSDTWARRWVRYEIFQSLKRGNSVFGIHINSIKGKDQQTKQLGPNPFNNLALEFDGDGIMAKPTEWTNKAWYYSSDADSYALKSQPHPFKGRHIKLTEWCPIYDWLADNGYANFSSWIGC